jgi:hypothetical protein
MTMNFGIIALAAIIPLIIGAIWYNPKVLGSIWMKASGVTEEQIKKGNMALIFGLTYLLCLFLGMMITILVIHQNSVASLFVEDPTNSQFLAFMELVKGSYRTFGHGAFHGVIDSLFFALPIIGIIALFERRGFKYIAIHVGYWMICMALMGGVICQFS